MTIQFLFMVPTTEAAPQAHVNPVPYYSQGSNPWCGVATARMTIAYVLYPKEPPSLEELAKEMGAIEKKGVSGYDWIGAILKRGIPAAFYDTKYPDYGFIRETIRTGFPVETTIIVGKEINWWYYYLYRIIVYDYALHSILIIGYDQSGFIYHGPDSPNGERAAMRISESELNSKWSYATIVKQTPKEAPSYTVRILIDGPATPVPIQVDAIDPLTDSPHKPVPTQSFQVVSVTELKFAIGTSHTFQAPAEILKDKNETTLIKWECLSGIHHSDPWILGVSTLSFRYRMRIWYWVKKSVPNNPWEGWIEKGKMVESVINQTDRVLPADGVLGQLGFKKSFTGWSVNGEMVSNNTWLTVRAERPMEITPIWDLDLREGHGYILLALYLALPPTMILLATLIARRRRKK